MDGFQEKYQLLEICNFSVMLSTFSRKEGVIQSDFQRSSANLKVVRITDTNYCFDGLFQLRVTRFTKFRKWLTPKCH